MIVVWESLGGFGMDQFRSMMISIGLDWLRACASTRGGVYLDLDPDLELEC